MSEFPWAFLFNTQIKLVFLWMVVLRVSFLKNRPRATWKWTLIYIRFLYQQVLDLVSRTNDTLGPVDIMVNCAGLGFYTTMKNCNLDEWEKMIDVNCKVLTQLYGHHCTLHLHEWRKNFSNPVLSITLSGCYEQYWRCAAGHAGKKERPHHQHLVKCW